MNKIFRLTGWFLGAMLLALSVPGMALAQDLVVVVPNDSPIPELSTQQVREVFMGEASRLSGTRLMPVMYVDGNPLQDAFLSRVLHIGTAAFNTHWMQRVFQNGGKPPKRVRSGSQAANSVLSNRGGIGFVTVDTLSASPDLRAVYRVRN